MRKITVLMIASFLAVQLLALGVGSAFISQKVSVVDNPADPANAGYFFAYVLFSAVLLLLLLKFYRGKMLFVFLEFMLLFFSMQILYSLALEPLPAMVLALATAAARFAYQPARPALLLLASGVVGALLGASLDLLPAVIFSALLAGYDVVAVFYTKHMIALAKGLNERGAAFSIQISSGEKPVKPARQAKATGTAKTVTARTNSFRLAQPPARSRRDEYETIELGTGDLVVPAMLQVSALKLSLLHAAFSFAGSVAGLAVLFYVLERQKGYWPALPPLVFGSLLMMGALQALLLLKVI